MRPWKRRARILLRTSDMARTIRNPTKLPPKPAIKFRISFKLPFLQYGDGMVQDRTLVFGRQEVLHAS
jgi:hypothetical protein